MKNTTKKIVVVIIIILLSLTFIPAQAATTFGVSSNVKTVKPGGTFTVNVSTNGEGRISAKVNKGGTLVSSSSFWYPEGKSFTVKAGQSGTVEVTVTAVDISDGTDNIIGASRTISVNISKGEDNTPNQPTSPPISRPDDKKPDKKVPEKSPEEKAKDELARRQLIPLIKEISYSSESERLKGEVLSKTPTSHDTFKYEYELPRNVDEFKLDLTPIAEDVKLTYDQMYKLDENHDKVEIKVTAVQDEITQEFQITVKRHVESDVKFEDGDASYNLIEDAILDAKLKEYGIEKITLEGEKGTSHYKVDGINFVLTYDKDKKATWILVDETGKFLQEAYMTVDKDGKVHFLVDVELDAEDKRTINSNKYERQEFVLPKGIVDFDSSIEFKNTVLAWNFEDKGIIAHRYKAPVVAPVTANVEEKTDESTDVLDDVILDENNVSSPYDLVYVGHDGEVTKSFVVFDSSGSNAMKYFAFSMLGLSILLLIILIAYWSHSNRKINALIGRKY